MKVLISYANEKFFKAQRLNSKTGMWIAGFDRVIEYGPEDVEIDFLEENKDIFKYQRGNGLWLWKPYFIYKTLLELKDGDILFYLDSGAFWTRSAKPLFDILSREDIYVADLPLIEKQFTKKYTFDYMGCYGDNYELSQQIQGTFIGFRKSKQTIEFVRKWLDYCCKVDMLSPNLYPEGIDTTFIAHREDQSILSLLCKKEGIVPHKDPTQYGRLPQKYHQEHFIFKVPNHCDRYKPMIVLHREAKANIKVCFRQWLCCVLPKFVSERFISNK